MSASCSDDEDSEGEPNDEIAKHVTAFTGRYESDEDSCDEDVSYEELVESYKKLCVISEEFCEIGVKQKRIMAQMHAEKEKLLDGRGRGDDLATIKSKYPFRVQESF